MHPARPRPLTQARPPRHRHCLGESTGRRAAQVTEAARREKRLKAAFGARAAAFREACYGLFGYRVDMDAPAAPAGPPGAPLPATTFTLKPMHADDARARAPARATRPLRRRCCRPCARRRITRGPLTARRIGHARLRDAAWRARAGSASAWPGCWPCVLRLCPCAHAQHGRAGEWDRALRDYKD
jgi:hypothetical protein